MSSRLIMVSVILCLLLVGCSSFQQARGLTLEVTPSEIDPGDSITLSWNAIGEEANICTDYSFVWQFVQPLPGDERCLTVPVEGSLVISTAQSVRGEFGYCMTVDCDPDTACESVCTSVKVRCPDPWFFPDPLDDCPESAPTTSPAMIQYFEHGQMIWLETTGEIYTLFDESDDSAFQSTDCQGFWLSQPDPWRPGMPETDPKIVSPTGYYQPVRRFGIVWREEYTRDGLGWAIEPEISYEATYQHTARLKHGTRFLSDPSGQVIALYGPGAPIWGFWTGAE